MLERVAREILDNPSFTQDLTCLRRAHASRLIGDSDGIEPHIFTRLAQASSVLASTTKETDLNLAYEIAAKLLHIPVFSNTSRNTLFKFVLQRIENFPAENFFSRSAEFDQLPTPITIDGQRSRYINSIDIAGTTYELTSYQRRLWQALSANRSVSTTAPTSAGKSFVITQYVLEKSESLNANSCIIYIVPSKALISQTSKDLRKRLSESGSNVEVVTVSPASDDKPPERAVYVFTQERLTTAYKAGVVQNPQLLVIDEAQEIGSPGRGTLLGSVIERTIADQPSVQLLFAGPNIRNPGVFSVIFSREIEEISTNQGTVGQSIYFIDRTENEGEGKLLIQGDSNRIEVSKIDFKRPMRTVDDRLISPACWLSGRGQTLVYVGGPGKAESVAMGIAEEFETEPNDALIELSELAKASVHKRYSLATDVLKGVGYHYGRMPTILREAVEKAFESGHLNYIVCTSTLLQGVNLPARNLIIHNPVKGNNKPIDGVEFWNLAGRAGRLGKEFEGNVFLVDYSDWSSTPLEEERLQLIEPSYEEQIKNSHSEIVEVLENKQGSTVFQDNVFETASTRLFSDFLNGQLNDVLNRANVDPDSECVALYEKALHKLAEETKLPLSVLSESPTVPVARQNRLHIRLKASLKKGGPDYVIPKHPMDTDAYQSHQMMYQRCYKEILGKQAGKTANRTTALSLLWSRGAPIPRLIDKAFEFSGENAKWATVIRGTLSDVENLLRFQCVRMTSCYIAILRYLLKDSGNLADLSRIPSISAYLEVGAASKTMLSLMSLGMSRFSASQIQASGAPQNLGRHDAIHFLKERAGQLDILPRCLAEATQIVKHTQIIQ